MQFCSTVPVRYFRTRSPRIMARRKVSVEAVASALKQVDLSVADPQCSRGFTYTMYEANAWQAKFAKSGGHTHWQQSFTPQLRATIEARLHISS